MAITRAQQVRQMLEDGGMLVSPSTTGKRPGYRSAKAQEVQGRTSSYSGKTGKQGPTDNRPDDKSSDLQTFNTKKATGKLGRLDRMGGSLQYKDGVLIDETGRAVDKTFRGGFTGDLNEREKEFQNFLKFRKPVKFPNYSMFKPFENVAQKFSNFNASINRPFFEKVIRAGKIPGLNFDMTQEELEDAYQNYMSERLSGNIDAYGNPLMGGKDRGPDNQILFPEDMENNTGDDSEDEEGNTNRERGLALRFLSRGGSPMDAPTEGGIMDLETGRQMYFLGKLVKKATRAVKKIAKSPIGKAAILGGAMYFGGGAGAGKLGKFFGTGSFNPFKTKIPGVGNMSSGLGKLLSKIGMTDFVTGDLTTKGMFGLGGGLLALLPFLSKDEQEQLISSRGVSINPGYIRDNPMTFASQVGSGSGTAFALAADGGRIGLKNGKTPSFEEYMQGRDKFEKQMNIEKKYREYLEQMRRDKVAEQKTMAADGGRIGYQEGSKEPVAKKTMPLLDMGGKEMDLRDDGGFVPIGRMEKADDVPARLSKNEFVFTADAVRNAGEGDVDKGAEVMYNMMKNLESGGEVSEESQGLEGAREMFQTSKRLEEVL
jgi:hypothetical protein